MIIYNRGFSLITINSQNRFWGYTFGEREVKVGRVVYVIVGIAAIVVGIVGICFPGRQ